MLPLAKTDEPPSKCLFTHGRIPAFVDESQPPTKRKPFSSILAQKWSHTVDLILPAELLDAMESKLEGDKGCVRFAKVMMSLEQVVEGDFFNTYVKKGAALLGLKEDMEGC